LEIVQQDKRVAQIILAAMKIILQDETARLALLVPTWEELEMPLDF